MKKNLNIAYLNGADIGKKVINVVETINNQDKTIEITENGSVEVVADKDYTGLGKVTVNVEVTTDEIISIPDAVRFIDYDGKVLYTYTKEEADNLTELPPLPYHEGLVCQGWNYDLNDIKEQDYCCEIGAVYITDNGETRAYVSIDDENDNICYLGLNITGTAIVDWGDGYIEEVSGRISLNHTYSIGHYIIRIQPVNESTITNNKSFFGNASWTSTKYDNKFRRIYIGDKVTKIDNLGYFANLEELTIPNNVTFNDTIVASSALKGFVFHKGITIVEAVRYNSAGIYYKGPFAVSMPNTVTAAYGNYSHRNVNRIIYPKSVVNFYNMDVNVAYYATNGHYSSGTHVKYYFNTNRITQHQLGLYNLINPNVSTDTSEFTNKGFHKSLFKNKNNQLIIIKELNIPDDFNKNITKIGNSAFMNIQGINKIVINNIASIGFSSFHTNRDLKEIIINGNTEINGKYTFFNCYNLKSIIFDETATITNGYQMFYNCYSLSYIKLPNNITNIDSSMFDNCVSLQYIQIPPNVSSISSAFSNCRAVLDFSNHVSVPSLSSTNYFSNITIVPDNLYDEWIIATNWANVTPYIIKKSDWDAQNN